MKTRIKLSTWGTGHWNEPAYVVVAHDDERELSTIIAESIARKSKLAVTAVRKDMMRLPEHEWNFQTTLGKPTPYGHTVDAEVWFTFHRHDIDPTWLRLRTKHFQR